MLAGKRGGRGELHNNIILYIHTQEAARTWTESSPSWLSAADRLSHTLMQHYAVCVGTRGGCIKFLSSVPQGLQEPEQSPLSLGSMRQINCHKLCYGNVQSVLEL